MARRPGRKGNYIAYSGVMMEGNESIGVGGLSKDRATGQHYCYYSDPRTGKRDKKVFSVDVDKAVRQYRRFAESLIGKKSVTFLKPDEVKSIATKLTAHPSKRINDLFECFPSAEVAQVNAFG
jgi:hypothetical protein